MSRSVGSAVIARGSRALLAALLAVVLSLSFGACSNQPGSSGAPGASAAASAPGY